MNEISKKIQDRISDIGKPEKAAWLENYVKHNIKSKGVGIPDIRNIIKETSKEYALQEKSIEEEISLLNDLMRQEYTEDKLAAILYLQLYWKGKNEEHTMKLISEWFDKNLITDWNVCDWLCVRIISPLVDNWTEEAVRELTVWNKSSNLWKARASLVPFAQCKSIAQHGKKIESLSETLIQREERFCKTAVGWALREYSRIDSDFVVRFLENYKGYTTKEVHKNATKYL